MSSAVKGSVERSAGRILLFTTITNNSLENKSSLFIHSVCSNEVTHMHTGTSKAGEQQTYIYILATAP